jgi:outer membrane protein assembly factor BamB
LRRRKAFGTAAEGQPEQGTAERQPEAEKPKEKRRKNKTFLREETLRRSFFRAAVAFALSGLFVLSGLFSAGVPYALAAGAPWPQAGADGSKDRRAAVDGPGGAAVLETRWRFRAPDGNFSGDPVVGEDGTVYAGTTTGAVYALDRVDGSVKWSVAPGYPVIGSPAVDASNSVVYVAYGAGSTYALLCLDAGNGSVRWSLRTPSYYGSGDTPVTASPAAGSDGVYVPLVNGVWKVSPAGQTSWQYKGLSYGDENHCSPAVAGGKVLFVTFLGYGYALSAADKSLLWSWPVAGAPLPSGFPGEITPAVSPDGAVVYFCLPNVSTVYAVYTAYRGGKWNVPLPGFSRPAAVGAGSTVYVSDAGGNLFALDPGNGSLRWSAGPGAGAAPAGSPAVAGDGTVYLRRGLCLCAFGPDGSPFWEYSFAAEGSGAGSPVLAGDGLVLVRAESPAGEAFLLAVGPDATPPALTACDPPGGAGEVRIDAGLTLTFSENVVAKENGRIVIRKWEDDATVEEIPAAGDRVTVSGNVVTIDPVTVLACGTRYYVLVGPGAFCDLAGNECAGIGEKGAWSFTTVSPPEVAATIPADGAQNVPLDTAITVIFDEEVRAGGASGGIKVFKTGDQNSVVAFTYRVDNTTLVIEPAEGSLEPGVAYTVYLPAGAVENLAGCPLARSCIFSFTAALADEPDKTPPTAPGNLTAAPAGPGAVDLAWTASADNAGVAGYEVEMRKSGDQNFTVIGTPAGTAFRATGLAPGTAYAFRVRAFDAAGNFSAYSSTAEATTPEDRTEPKLPPRVVARSPEGSGAAASGNLSATFDLAVRAAGPQGVPFLLAPAGGAASVLSGAVGADGRTVTAPYGNLAYSTAYTVTLPAGSVTSVIYATVNEEESWSFTTAAGPDTVPPHVVATFPADGQKNVPADPVITVTFSEPVAPGDEYGRIALYAGSRAIPVATGIDGCVLSINPQIPLTGGLFFTVIVPAGAVRDAAGNPLAAERSFAFAVRPDSSPADGGDGGGYDPTGGDMPAGPGSANAGGVPGPAGREAAPRPAAAFSDLAGHWARETIGRLAAQGLVAGYPDGTFRPERPLTRAEAAALLVRVVKAPPPSAEDLRAAGKKMADAAEIPAWALRAAAAAVREGLVRGSAEDGGALFFAPERAATRAELAVMLVRARGAKTKQAPPGGLRFADAGSKPPWAAEELAAAAGAGLVRGYPDGALRPAAPVTRAEAAAMLERFLEISAPPALRLDRQGP